MTKYTASTIINYSPRKARLVINPIRGMRLDQALVFLRTMPKQKAKKVHDLLKSAASNLGVSNESDLPRYKIDTIVAEEAQKYFRVVPRARGSAARIRRRYARIKVLLVDAVLTTTK